MKEEELIRLSEYIDTPSYVFDLESLTEHIRQTREKMGTEYGICFAMKANPFLVSGMSRYTDRLEVCSPGEYEICIREGIEAEKIIVSGVNKTEESMMRILDYSKGKGIYTIESPYQYEVLRNSFLRKGCQAEIGRRPKVILRLSSGNQFGMDKHTLEKVLLMNYEDNAMDIIGLHFYAGTQKKMKVIKKEVEQLNEYAAYLKKTYGISDLELEYGPGLAVSYFSGEQPDDGNMLREFREALNNLSEYKSICIELGRYLTADCGYYFTKVEDVKCTEATGYVIVDGGIHQINYFGQVMGMKQPYMTFVHQNKTEEEEVSLQICGSLCTANDIIVRGVMLPYPKRGDVLIFKKAGAYSVTEGMSMFLSRELPNIYLRTEDGKVTCIRKQIETNLFNTKFYR